MEKKFMPADSESNKFREPFYLESKLLLYLAAVSAFVPFVGLIVVAMITVKSQRADKYLKQINDDAAAIRAKVDADIKQIFAEAEEKIGTIISEADKKGGAIIDSAHVDAEKILSGARTELAELEEKISDRQRFVASLVAKATEQSERRNAEIRRELAFIQAEIDKRKIYFNEVEQIKQTLAKLQKKETSLTEKIDSLMRLRAAVNNAVKTYMGKFPDLPEHMINLTPGVVREIESLAPSFLLKLHSMDYKDLRRLFRANNKLIEDVLTRYENRYTLKNNRTIYRLMVIALRAELQNILYTLTSTKLDDALAAVREVTNKYLNIAREGNQTITSTLAKFVGEMESLFVDAVKIEYEYFVKKEAARQEQLELRAKMREEAEEQQRLKEQQAAMEREESKYNSEIENLLEQARLAGEEKNQALLDKVRSLELQLANLASKKEEILRLQTGKAGYVYIISNLGSFGDDVFKVGMTRRLDPQERIDELGSASVPFKFDVHSFIFSEDAVKLESDLHSALNAHRLNKVNLRKEFFKVSIDELERLVEQFDPAAEFNRTMQAEQYYQSLSVVGE